MLSSPSRSVRRYVKSPVETQVRVLRQLLQEAGETEWGKRFEFQKIARESDPVRAFQQSVPLHSYDDIREDIVRVRNQAENVLWPGRIRYFATTAGTTSAEKKVIPVSIRMFREHLRYGLATVGGYVRRTRHWNVLLGFPMNLGGRVESDPHNSANRIGEISGLFAEYWSCHGWLPQALKRRRVFPADIRDVGNWNEKLDRIVDFAMDKDVRMATMTPSWGLGLFERLIQRYNQRHQRQVTTVGEIWPDLQLVVTGAVPLRAYRNSLEQRIGLPQVDFLETYGASEGFFAYQNCEDDPALQLHLDGGIFFEFVRLDQFYTAQPRRFTVADVETDVSYIPVVSTCSGLWAYGMGDVVRFTSVSPHKLVVIGRISEMLDSYGEFVRGEQLREALRDACTQTHSNAAEFHLVPRPSISGEQHAHEWLIEFDAPPAEFESFARHLDEKLKLLNADYEWCRRAKGFGPPRVVPIPQGTLVQCLTQKRADIGAQTKVPCLSDNRDLAESVLAMLK